MNIVKLIFKNLFSIILNIYSLFYLGLFITDYSFLSFLLNKISNVPEICFSNIAPHTPLLIFLLFVMWLIDKESFREVFIVRIIFRIAKLSDRKFLFFIFLLIVSVLLVMSLTRHLSFGTASFDLGIYDQAVWNTTKGDVLVSSLKDNMNLLGDHFVPILLLIVPFYFLWSSPMVLLIIQSLALGATVFPLYLIAKHRLSERSIIFALLISYFLSSGLRGVGLSDFHPDCFIVPLLFLCYYLLITKKTGWFFVAIFLLLLCKETAAFFACAFGIYVYFIQKRKTVGTVLFLGGIFVWILVTKFIIPYFNPQGEYAYLARLPFGNTYTQNIKFILSNPPVFMNLIFHPTNTNFYLKLFGSVGFLSLLSPAHFILIAIPLFKIAMGVNNPAAEGMAYMHSHHVSHLLPFIYISAVYGASWIVDKFSQTNLPENKSRRKNVVNFLSIYIIVIALLFYGKTDGYKFTKFLKGMKRYRSSQIRSYLRLVPKDASVATNFNLVPHLSHREYIFIWNPNEEISNLVEYAVIDKKLLTYIPSDQHNQINEFFGNFSKLGYVEVFSNEDDSFVILFNPEVNNNSIKRYFDSRKKPSKSP